MCVNWRLVDSGALPTAQSAAVDEAVLECRASGLVPDTLHLYARSQPTVSLGRFQKVAEAVDLKECERRGVAIVRRCSGGGSVYTDSGQLIFALIASQKTLGDAPTSSFEVVCTALAVSLRRMGIDARYRPINDVEVDGKKVSGSAQLRRRGAVLHHGTLLVDSDLETMNAVLRAPSIAPSRRVTTLSELFGEMPDIDRIKQSIITSFQDAFGALFERGQLIKDELKLVDEYVTSYYGSDEWNLKL